MRYNSLYKEDTGYTYPDGTPIKTTDRVSIQGYDMLGTIHSRKPRLKDGTLGKTQYFVVIAQPTSIDPHHTMPYKQITLARAVEMGIEWRRSPSAEKKMQTIVSGTEKAERMKEGRKAYIVAQVDYDHVQIVYR